VGYGILCSRLTPPATLSMVTFAISDLYIIVLCFLSVQTNFVVLCYPLSVSENQFHSRSLSCFMLSTPSHVLRTTPSSIHSTPPCSMM